MPSNRDEQSARRVNELLTVFIRLLLFQIELNTASTDDPCPLITH
ncbi:hypothetical protein RBSH_00133 [Rhodopirellula baltica SH28]|uniref:Uncharacterized protein n=1 Tax=Rhodopirellula baltica SH28 TaxID=993517 RepID=K5DPT5_RHOBT|nr:hypothetical protein RBSH_00133 [Rhodopirellula baltica SH28]